MNIRPGYTFDDVLLEPKHSDIPSRNEEHIDLSVSLGKGIKLSIPIVSANMKSITEASMGRAITSLGGMALLHRFGTNMLGVFQEVNNPLFGMSVGVKPEDQYSVDKFVEAGCKVLCVDVAHGDHNNCVQMTEYIAKKHPDVLLISGNVATASGALRLYNAGANVIKVGIGGGSLCTTRIETGNGVPQLTALEDVYNASLMFETRTEYNQYSFSYPDAGIGSVTLSGLTYPQTTVLPAGRKFKIIADGGIRRGGDIIKALCFSDAVMLGNLLAGTDETPGKVLFIDGKSYKEYAGSSTHKANNVEGVSALVPTKGPVKNIINKLMEGLMSGLSYQGSANLEELKEDPRFISVSHAGLIESHPHDVMVK